MELSFTPVLLRSMVCVAPVRFSEHDGSYTAPAFRIATPAPVVEYISPTPAGYAEPGHVFDTPATDVKYISPAHSDYSEPAAAFATPAPDEKYISPAL